MESLEVASTHSSEFDGSSIIGEESDSSNGFAERVRVDRRKLEEMLQGNRLLTFRNVRSTLPNRKIRTALILAE